MKHSLFIVIVCMLSAASLSAQNVYAGKWVGKLSIGQASLSLVFNIKHDEKDSIVCTMDSPDQGAFGIKTEASIESFSGIKVTVPSVGASFKGMMFQESIVGTFSQMGNDFPLTLTRLPDVLNRPQTPVAPFPYEQEDVSFVNTAAGATLAGTLTIPADANALTPVVIMVSGSGQQNRDEEIFQHKPFAVIADCLARNGIASLRYDDRGVGESHGGDVKNATTLDFTADTKAGIDFLKKDGRFSKIGILGHSEGASIAFILGTAGHVDFVISLAGIGVKGDEALTAQTNRILELQGAEMRLTVDMYRANALAQGIPWINWFINYNPVPDIENCSCPVFAANGDKDIQIISSLNLVSIQNHLPENGKNFTKEYPSLNHMFQHCTTGAVSEYGEIEESISPELLQDIVNWIKQ